MAPPVDAMNPSHAASQTETPCVLTLMTPSNPGAVAILQLHGPGTTRVIRILGEKLEHLQVGQLRLLDFAGIDHGLLTRIAPDTWQFMPHGGPRIVQQLRDWLTEQGVKDPASPDALSLFPEAASPIEADVLAAIATASSPAAIDRLAAQPMLWREKSKTPEALAGLFPRRLPDEQQALQHLLAPPAVVVVGPPNAGKSTLLNALAGRTLALVADLPGTTRDWVGGLIELAPPGADALNDAVAVRWLDTPGLRDSGDAIEQRAITAAREVIETADVLIAMRDPHQPWPAFPQQTRQPDLWVINKADQLTNDQHAGTNADHTASNTIASQSMETPLTIQATDPDTLDPLIHAVLSCLGVDAIPPDALWAFSPTLHAFVENPARDISAYLGLS